MSNSKHKAEKPDYWRKKVREHYGADFELITIGELENRHNRHFVIECKKCGNQLTTCTSTLNNHNKRGYCKYCGKRPYDRKPLEISLIRYCGCGAVLPTDKRIKVCSNCKVERSRENGRRKDIKRRARLRETEQDKDITLKKVYAKDSGVCYLCGCLCNWNDYQKRGNCFIAGKTYPTIEHIKPLSKGGAHVWGNIRLACHYCNSIKSDKVAG